MGGNANSGRRPAPADLTLLRGNPSKTRVNDREPVAPAGEVPMPAGLSPGAAGVWQALAPVCVGMRVLTRADVWAFRTLCELQATLVTAATWKGKPGKVQKGIALERATAAAIRPYYAMFGLEPSSRARLVVPKADDEPVNKWAGMVK